MAVVAAEQCGADKIKYTCVVKDETQTNWKKTSNVFSLAFDCQVSHLYSEAARQLGYQEGSFLLYWEKVDNVDQQDIELDDDSSQTLMELGLNEKRNRFFVREKNARPPVTIREESADTPGTTTSGATVSTVSNNYNNQYSSYNYSSTTGSGKSETGFVGLVNQAMTCYLNSLLQTLYMTPEFRNALYKWTFDGTADEEERSIPYQLQRLFTQLQTSDKRSVETTDITRSFGWDSSEAWQQHDVQELCRVMFDALEQKFANSGQGELINQLYQGKMKDYVKCLECHYESAREDSYLDIPLVIKPFGSDKAYGSVEEALTEFITPETLSESNQYDCERCGKKCDAHKGLKFTSFPYLLTLQLKRFDFDYITMSRIKLNDRMTFPLELNLNGYVSHNGDDPLVLQEARHSQSELTDDMPDGETDDTDTDGSTVVTTVSAVAADPSPSVAAVAAAAADLKITYSSSSSTTSNKPSGVILTNDGPEGPYIYELFSIMVHSGSAIGGHYYAYIKSFSDGQWYCFNDHMVSRITEEDIKKTYGGSDRSHSSYYFYSSAYAASANAYMLMYRQSSPERNCEFWEAKSFPEHILELRDKMKQQEEFERQQKEFDRSVCKIKLFCQHPTDHKLLESRLEVHKDKTLADATEIAYNMFNLQNVVSLDQCRLVKYDEYYESLERSFEGHESVPISKVLGGVRHSYSFDLLLEIREKDQKFKAYQPGGVTVKAYLVDLEKETVSDPVVVRSHQSDTIADLTQDVADAFDVPHEKMRLCVEQYYREVKLLEPPDKLLKQEIFYKAMKVFAEVKGEDNVPFDQSRLFKFLDSAANVISLSVTVPSSELHQNGEVDSDKSQKNRSNMNNASVDGNSKDDDQPPPLMPKPKTITMKIDRRSTLADLKQRLEVYVGQPSNQFRMFRVYANSQEFEVSRLDDTLTTYSDDTKLVVKFGRALAKGEYRVKVYELQVNNPEVQMY
jgi:ubiquitin carboxyl-terminal hydrolase 47